MTTKNLRIHYFFEDKDSALIEVERIDLKNCPDLNRRFHWFYLLKESSQLSRLQFVSMSKTKTKNVRRFQEGCLYFDNLNGILDIFNGIHNYQRNSSNRVEQRYLDMMDEYFKCRCLSQYISPTAI